MPSRSRTQHIAVIEIGTNSTKFFVARVGNDRHFTSVYFAKKTTRIGRGTGKNRRIEREGVDRTLHALTRFKKTARTRGCDRLFAFSTFVLRRASNAASVVRRLERALGSRVKILTGKQEARFAFLSAHRRLGLKKPHTVLVDIGGGSTEIVVARRGRIVHARSLPLGALHLTEQFIRSDPIEPAELTALMGHVDRVTGNAFGAAGIKELEPSRCDLVASGGSVATATQMLFGKPLGSRLRSGDVAALLDRCVSMTLRERKRIAGLEPSRADIIPAGLAVVLSCMRHTGKRVLYPNPGGVREGALVHLIANEFDW
jgi:exopolyphosphatase/guanosine-5'-triphosphate,3'-diphosphate pyrophosphatase